MEKADTLVLMDEDYYCNTLVIKHHLNTSIYQNVSSNRDKQVFNNLKFLTKKQKSCLAKNELKYILNSNRKLSNFYVLQKVHKSKKIIEEINESNNICLNMQPSKEYLLQLVRVLLPKASNIDQGITNANIDVFRQLLNELHPSLKTTVEKGKNSYE